MRLMILLLLGGSLFGAPAAADWIVLRGGARIPTRGLWTRAGDARAKRHFWVPFPGLHKDGLEPRFELF